MIHLSDDPQFSFDELEVGETFMRRSEAFASFYKENIFIKIDERVCPVEVNRPTEPVDRDLYNCVSLKGILDYCESWEKVQIVELSVRRK